MNDSSPDCKKPHILFVTEKWRDAKPDSPPTVIEQNLFATLDESGLATSTKLHFDEFYCKHNIPCDDEVIRIVEKERPDITVFVFIPWYQHIPTLNTVAKVSTMSKCVFVWPDAAVPHHMSMAERYDVYATMSILWDIDVPWIYDRKFIHLWTPQNEKNYYDAGLDRDINVSFLGSSFYEERMRYLHYLQREEVRIFTAGGNHVQMPGTGSHPSHQRPMTVPEYANILQRSKISLNFCLNGSHFGEQLKGRVFEIMMCGAMLMESRYTQNWIDRWFIPFIHYVPFNNEKELQSLINHYLVFDDDRRRIAENGHRRCVEWYNGKLWWKYVLEKCGIDKA